MLRRVGGATCPGIAIIELWPLSGYVFQVAHLCLLHLGFDCLGGYIDGWVTGRGEVCRIAILIVLAWFPEGHHNVNTTYPQPHAFVVWGESAYADVGVLGHVSRGAGLATSPRAKVDLIFVVFNFSLFQNRHSNQLYQKVVTICK